MKRFQNIIIDITSYSFIILFVYAAVSKLLDFQNFEVQLGRSPMLARYGGWYWLVPAVEILISFLLAIPKFQIVGLYASFSLMTMFSTYIIAILNYSEYIPCSCGGILQKMTWTTHLWFNTIFVLLAGYAILIKPKPQTVTPFHSG